MPASGGSGGEGTHHELVCSCPRLLPGLSEVQLTWKKKKECFSEDESEVMEVRR